MEASSIEPAGAPAADGATLVDRRRPGRAKTVDPALIPLLRGQYELPLGEGDGITDDDEDDDQLGAARGIALACLLSGVFWAGLAYVGHRVLS